ncbi:MAG: translocation/assembly module TamB domain-containing protein, partial [Candidatus Zixiibacteriota bacterium]
FQLNKNHNSLLLDSIHIGLSGSLTDGVLAANIDSLALNYPLKGFRLRELHAGIALSSSAIGIDSMLIATDSSRIIGGGVYPLDRTTPFRFSLRNSRVSLTEIGHALGIGVKGVFDVSAELTGQLDNFAGQTGAKGVLYGREIGPFTSDYEYNQGILAFSNFEGELFGGTMRGSLDINFLARPETFKAELEARGFDLLKVLPTTFPSRLNGNVVLNGSGFNEATFNMDISAKLGPGQFDFVRFDSVNGDMSLNVKDMYFQPGFTLWYENSVFTTEGVVNYDGEMLLNGDFHTAQLADFWGDVFIKELSGRAQATYEVSGPVLDPDIRGQFFGDSCSFYGFSTDSIVAGFDIASFLYGRRGHVDALAWKSDVWSLPADSVRFSVDIDSNLVDITRATQYSPRMLLDAKANATLVDSTAFVTVTDFLFQFDSLKYNNAVPIKVDFLADRIVVRDLRLQGNEGLINIDADYGYDSTIDLHVVTENFNFATWLKQLEVDSSVIGGLSLDGRMTGKLANPTIVITGAVNDILFNTDSLGSATSELRFQDSTLTFHNFTLRHPGFEIYADGYYPLVLNLDSGVVYVPTDRQIQINLKSSGADLGIVSSFNSDVESFSGDFQLDLQIYGTSDQPQSKGTFNLQNGKIKVYQMANMIEDLQAQVSSNDKQIIVEWVEGRVNHKRKKLFGSSTRSGTVRAAGEINIISKDVFDYSLAIVGDDVPFQYDLGEIFARADFDLSIRGAYPPLISGDITALEAEYLDEFDDELTSTAIAAADTVATWDYDINLEMLPASVSVKNSTMNMVVDGKLRVLRENARDNYFGTLNIVRGTMYVGDLNFRIQEGSYLSFDNIEEPDPQLYINATWKVRNMGGDITSSSFSEVPLQIRGTIARPTLGAGSGSQYSDEDIATLMLINQSASGQSNSQLGSDFQNRLQVGGAGYVFARTSQVLTRTFGLETFEITPVYGDRNNISGAALSLGAETLPNVYTYVSSLSTDGRADYGAEYRLGRHVTLGGQYDRDRLWRLNMLLNWEFR